ncbi:MAG TPA: HAMP domain-containing sensor histidine kinase [Dehalococcoidia bacterium]|nr:HAMP domain-containing sensor histidine kinase [Dehalococcoidia bacterium]
MLQQPAARGGSAEGRAAAEHGFARAWGPVRLLAGDAIAAVLAIAALYLAHQRWPSILDVAGLGIIALATGVAVFGVLARAKARRPRPTEVVLLVLAELTLAAVVAIACVVLLAWTPALTLLAVLAGAAAGIAGRMPASAKGWRARRFHRRRTTAPGGVESSYSAEGADPDAVLYPLAAQIAATGSFACVRVFTLSDDQRALVLRAAASAEQGWVAAPPEHVRLVLDRCPLLAEVLKHGSWRQPGLGIEREAFGQDVGAGLNADAMIAAGPLIATEPARGLVVVKANATASASAFERDLATLRVGLARRRPEICAALATDLVSQIGLPFGRLLRDLPSPLLLLNRYARVIVVNAAAERALGRVAASLIGLRLCAGPQECDCVLHRALRGEGPIVTALDTILVDVVLAESTSTASVWAVAAPGQSGIVAVSLAPEGHAKGGTPEDDLSGLDLTAMMAHDLRSPLTALRVASQLAIEDDVTTDERLYLMGNVARLVERTDKIAADVLDAYQASARPETCRRDRVNLRQGCTALIDELALSAADSSRIHICLDPALTVFADGAKLRTVLRNLLTNAIKHTSPDDSISVSACRFDGEVRITVRDSGPGIAAEVAPRVFDRFYRGGAADERPAGHGLGLFIVRRLVHTMGGQIWLEPGSGQGAAFTFTLPELAPVELVKPALTPTAVAVARSA